MMTDRELLELAAKAAGLEGEWKTTVGGWPCLILPGHHAWQPLHDDGDALRLAVQLELAPLVFREERMSSCVVPLDGVG